MFKLFLLHVTFVSYFARLQPISIVHTIKQTQPSVAQSTSCLSAFCCTVHILPDTDFALCGKSNGAREVWWLALYWLVNRQKHLNIARYTLSTEHIQNFVFPPHFKTWIISIFFNSSWMISFYNSSIHFWWPRVECEIYETLGNQVRSGGLCSNSSKQPSKREPPSQWEQIKPFVAVLLVSNPPT
jgi:hypothetical protein